MRSHLRWFIAILLVAVGAAAILTAVPRDDQLTANVLVGQHHRTADHRRPFASTCAACRANLATSSATAVRAHSLSWC